MCGEVKVEEEYLSVSVGRLLEWRPHQSIQYSAYNVYNEHSLDGVSG